jgi:geranylgeranyl diphosphate synthase type I
MIRERVASAIAVLAAAPIAAEARTALIELAAGATQRRA